MKQRYVIVSMLAAFVLTACQSAAPTSTSNAPPSLAEAAPSAAAPQPTAVPAPTAAPSPEPSAMPEPTAAPTPEPAGPPAPELAGGGEWINSAPLTLAELRGKVVLIDFWTYGCYNCKNTLPFVKQWWEKYQDQGLVIVGVHTPEFKSEYELANVQAAVEREGIAWPVVQDNDKNIWRAYENHYWPRFYLINHEGQIIYDHIGEGAYEQTEQQIAAALAAAN